MFQPTASEFLILKQISNFSDCKSIEETELFEVLRSACSTDKSTQNDEDSVQDDGSSTQDDGITLQTFKNAISGCVAKGFVQKSERGGKSFYKITDNGKNQI